MIGDDVIDGSGVDAEVDSTNWPWGSHWGATKVLFPSAGHPSCDVKSNTCKHYLFPLSTLMLIKYLLSGLITINRAIF